MKLIVSLTLVAIAVVLSDASESQCKHQYGPEPVPAPVYVAPPPTPAPVSEYYPAPVYVPPPPTPAPVNPYYHNRVLTFDPRCEKYGYHRALQQQQQQQQRNLKVVTTQELVTLHGDVCSTAQYDIYLVIQGAHFAGLGTPIGNEYASCPNIVMHSKSEGTAVGLEKVVMIAGSDEVALVSADEKLHLGSRPLSSIVAAFDGVEAGMNGKKSYDPVTNNCVALLRNMADPLDISIDDRLIRFVSNRMLQKTADHMFELIRASPGLNALYHGGQRLLKGVSKEDTLAKLIKLYV